MPTPLPSIECEPGTFYNEDRNRCDLCEIGRYANASMAPWPRECALCDPGKVALEYGALACQ